MTGRLVVVSGTGTGIGKTHVAAALVLAWRARRPDAAVVGLKPVESGIDPSDPAAPASDGATLEQVSTFHVKRFHAPYLLKRAVSPHLAARDEGRTVELGPILDHVQSASDLAEIVVVELAGGLFSPLGPALTNADVAGAFSPTDHVLVAPDRLGVLHDVGAVMRATAGEPTRPTAIVLVAPADESRDASTGTNAAELALVTDVPVVAVLPRGPLEGSAARLGGWLASLTNTGARSR